MKNKILLILLNEFESSKEAEKEIPAGSLVCFNSLDAINFIKKGVPSRVFYLDDDLEVCLLFECLID